MDAFVEGIKDPVFKKTIADEKQELLFGREAGKILRDFPRQQEELLKRNRENSASDAEQKPKRIWKIGRIEIHLMPKS